MKNLFVGNMSFQTTENELTELFKPFGAVTRIRVVMDPETGAPPGLAVVEMPKEGEAPKAVAALDGKSVGGRNIKVNEARPKGESTGPKFGGSKFGGQGGNRTGGRHRGGQ